MPLLGKSRTDDALSNHPQRNDARDARKRGRRVFGGGGGGCGCGCGSSRGGGGGGGGGIGHPSHSEGRAARSLSIVHPSLWAINSKGMSGEIIGRWGQNVVIE